MGEAQVPGRKKVVVLEEEGGKVIAMNSTSEMTAEETGQVVIAGSHGSDLAARRLAQYRVFGAILNDAGKGKENAGISGLPVLEAMNILGATVDCMTARIGEGEDSFRSGIISVVNPLAHAAGIRVGMAVAEAAQIMLAARKAATMPYQASVIYEGPEGRIVLADSISYLNESHRGSVVVCGSHCAHTTVVRMENLGLKGIFQNDAGKGKDHQGISALPVYDRLRIPAGAIDCMTAKIGHARDAWESGRVSVVNHLSAEIGIMEGMAVKEAAHKILKARNHVDGG